MATWHDCGRCGRPFSVERWNGHAFVSQSPDPAPVECFECSLRRKSSAPDKGRNMARAFERQREAKKERLKRARQALADVKGKKRPWQQRTLTSDDNS
jgi:hypothetical protein